ncbi:hypothetical protein B0H13DRAFT_875288 [Mycena leptocephala]|nr:hypothetical protein B0H13DRAFT_875288 [Mycena leptocephala]
MSTSFAPGLRPRTPDSPLTSRDALSLSDYATSTRDSLYDATTTIDELTQALENVSRVPSPEPRRSSSAAAGGRTARMCRRGWG